MIEIEQSLWGMNEEGEAVILYTLRNNSGAEVRVSNLGAAIVGFTTPDRNGKLADIVLGYASATDYLKDTTAMGRVVGRTAGITRLGRLHLDDTDYTLDRNAGRHHKDGGAKGFSEHLWESWVENNRLAMALASESGDMGYPGEVNAQLIFDFDDEGTLEITYLAKSEAATPVNMTHNLLFNLSGASSVLDHELQLHASRVAEIDPMEIPTGVLLDTASTALDFHAFRRLKEGIDSPFNHIADLGGYDHTLAIDNWKKNILCEAGTLRDPRSGRTLQLLTSQPALTLSTANTLKGSCPAGKSGAAYEDYAGVGLRAMNFPDAANHPEFPSPLLEKGELYCQKVVFRPGTY